MKVGSTWKMTILVMEVDYQREDNMMLVNQDGYGLG